MPANKSQVRFLFTLLAIVWGFLVGANSLLAAWSTPTAVPPGNNPDPFLSTNSVAQTKTGVLTVDNDFYIVGNGLTGHVGLGTTTATSARLVIAPIVNVASNNASIDAGSGYIATGWAASADTDVINRSYLVSTLNASLDPLKYWTLSGNNLYASSTSWRVGIGNTNPAAALDIRGEGNTLLNVKREGDVFDAVKYRRTNGTWTDITYEAGITRGTVSGDILNVVGDYFFVGKSDKFDKIYIDIGTARSATAASSFEYSLGGNSWSTLNVNDGTVNLTTDGTISFTAPADWATDTQDGVTGYWVRIGTVSGTFSTEPTVYLVVPYESKPLIELYSNGTDTLPALNIDANGYLNLRNVNSITSFGTISASSISASAGGFSGSLYNSKSSIGLNSADGIYTTTGAATAALPIQLSPRFRLTGTAWDNGISTSRNFINETVPIPGNPGSAKLTWSYGYNSILDVDTKQLMSLGSEGTLDVFSGDLGPEVLSNGTITTPYSGWTASNGFTLSSDRANYTHNANGGTLAQPMSSFATPLKPNRWYVFSYSTASVVAGVRLYIGTEVSTKPIYLQGQALTGTYDVLFKTNSAPGDFVIYANSNAGSLRFDSLSLREKIGGDIIANGLFTGGGPNGLKIDGYGNVGIGTTSPTVSLYVNGYAIANTPTDSKHLATKGYVDTAAQSLWINSGSFLYASSTNWRVGIGTTSPATALHLYPRTGIEGLRIISSNFAPLVIRDATDQNDLFRVNQSGDVTAVTSSATRMRSNNYCDASGNNCFDPSSGWSSAGYFATVTTATYSGNNNNNPGYAFAHARCDDQLAGTHVCSAEEILNTIRENDPNKPMPTVDVWIFNGPPGYTAMANDCDGRRSNIGSGTNTAYGSYWQMSDSVYLPHGRGLLYTCEKSLKFACCK